jgi:hypothetical protein
LRVLILLNFFYKKVDKKKLKNNFKKAPCKKIFVLKNNFKKNVRVFVAV